VILGPISLRSAFVDGNPVEHRRKVVAADLAARRERLKAGQQCTPVEALQTVVGMMNMEQRMKAAPAAPPPAPMDPAFVHQPGRIVIPESDPAKGFYFRSDHFEFAKVGVPALYLDKGIDVIDKPEGYGKAKRQSYIDHDYHQVTDTVKPDWDLSGAAEDIQLLFQVGLTVANTDTPPQWKPTSEFRPAGEERLKKR